MQQEEDKPDFGFVTVIHPAFQDKANADDQFQTHLTFKIKDSVLTSDWAYNDNKDAVVPPLYAGIVYRTPVLTEVEFLVTGGAVQVEKSIFTTNGCFRVSFQSKLGGLRLNYVSQKDGKIVENEDGEEVQEKENVVPDMLQVRHNHRLYELKQDNQFVYLAIGGQYVIDQNNAGVLNSCEKLVEKHQVSPNVFKSKWMEIASMNHPRAGFSGFTLNNKIYVFGGFTVKDGQSKFLNANESEVYDLVSNTWSDLKLKWKLGLASQNLGSYCLPINENKVLIFGGSNGVNGPTDSVTVLDLNKKQVESVNVKMSVGRAGMQGLLLKKQKLTYKFRTETSESVRNEFTDVLVLLGGALNEISFDIFKVNGEKVELLQKEEVSQEFLNEITGKATFFQSSGEQGWISMMHAYPVLLYPIK